MVIHAGLHTAVTRLQCRIRGKCDDRTAGRRRFQERGLIALFSHSDLTGRIEPVENGHIAVHEDEVNRFSSAARAPAAPSGAHSMVHPSDFSIATQTC